MIAVAIILMYLLGVFGFVYYCANSNTLEKFMFGSEREDWAVFGSWAWPIAGLFLFGYILFQTTNAKREEGEKDK